ncbi:MAG: hypothetical protein Kow00106_14750 [Anaerolineae bacterium]
MDAQELFRQGVIAIRDQKDLARGRELLVQSLKLDPRNDMAWLWLTHTTTNPAKRLELVERALRVNPNNAAALKLKARLLAAQQAASPSPPPAASESEPTPQVEPTDTPAAESTIAVVSPLDSPSPTKTPSVIQPLKRKTIDEPVTPAERERIALLMDRADAYQQGGDIEQAIALWVEVLSIRVDHELALRNAAGHLWKLQYWDDARELIQRAIDAGTRVPTVYLTAIDMAERRGDANWSAELREKVATLPTPDEALVVKVADYYLGRGDANIAQRFLEQALAAHPDMPAALIKLGDMARDAGDSIEATRLYERAARAKAPGKVRKEVDKKLRTALPVLTDRERGNVWLAVREALGVAGLFLLLGWQDARLDLLALGPRRWLGVLISLAGGYLVVTATSSPQQKPLAGWLGGAVPPPQPPPPPRGPLDPEPFRPPGRALQEPTELPLLPVSVRLLLALAGLVLLILAFVLVLSQSLEWVGDHRPPYLPW